MIRPCTFDGMLDRNVPLPTFRCDPFIPFGSSNRRSSRTNSLGERRSSSRQEN